MQAAARILLLSLGLFSCGTSKDDRYRDTAMLERPPALVVNRQAGEFPTVDNSRIPKKRSEKGLGEAVYLTTTTPPQLKIKQAFDDAWNTLGLALKQGEIEITDREHDKGLYYVSYEPGGSLLGSLFGKKQNQAIYVLTVESDGAETKITAILGNAAEQASSGGRGRHRGSSKDNSASQPNDGAEKLLQSLYETMRDDLKDE
jgi:uncharacterized lipoprotein